MNDRIRYKINYYNADKLIETGKRIGDFLVCDAYSTDYSHIDSFEQADCLLFDQTVKALGSDINLSNIFIVIDFSEIKNKFEELLKYKNGIKLFINNEYVIFRDFLKSNSMSKNSRVYYINDDYYHIIKDRVTLGFDKVNEISIAKWYAYSGLCLSDATILNDITIKKNELCIIKDKEIQKKINCVTGISIPILLDIFNEYNDRINHYLSNEHTNYKLNELYDLNEKVLLKECPELVLRDLDEKIYCYYNSKDFETLPDDIKYLIKDLIDILNTCNIFEIPDEIQHYLINAAEELIKGKKEIQWYKIYVENFEVKINCFDGEGLVSKEFAEEINSSLTGREIHQDDEEEERESKNGNLNSFQIRLPFLKGVIHAVDFKSFCKKHNITEIEGIVDFKDNRIAKYKVDELKMIITESQFKASSFMKYMNHFTVNEYFNMLELYDYHLAISGVEPKEKSNVKLCYQFLSTLPIKPNELDYLIEENKEYLSSTANSESVIEGLVSADSNNYSTGVEFYEMNKDFYTSTSIYLNKRRDIFDYTKRSLALGKLNVNGTRKYISGDIHELLYYIVGKKMPRNLKLTPNQFYCPNTLLNNKNIILRNPHYSRNEIVILDNCINPSSERFEYLGHLTGVIMFSPESLSAERLGGADYDGDEVCIVNDNRLLEQVYNNIVNDNKYIYPLVKIPSLTKFSYSDRSYEERIKCLESTFSNRTGQISNLAFEKTLVEYWNNNVDNKDEVSFFTILGGLEIDSIKNGKRPSLPKRSNKKNSYLMVKDTFSKKHIKNTETNIQKEIKTINQEAQNNTLYYVFNSFINEKLPPINSSFEIDCFKVSNHEELLECLAIEEAFNHILHIVTNDKKNNIAKSNEIKDSIKLELSKIFSLNSRNLHIESLLQKFSYDVVNNFNKYFDINCGIFHYYNQQSEKVNYINNYLGVKILTEDELMALCDFNNNGYKALFLVLYYNYLSDDTSRLKSLISSYNEEKLQHKLIKEKQIDKDEAIELINTYLVEACNVFDETSSINYLVEIINHFAKLAKHLSYEVVFNVINPKTSNNVFTIYKKQLKQYLRDLEEKYVRKVSSI